MPTILPARTMGIPLAAGAMLEITANADGTGRLFQGQKQIRAITAGSKRLIGPFPTQRDYAIHCDTGAITFGVVERDLFVASSIANVEPFTGNLALSNDDAGKVFRCDDASNVTVTVPANLVEGYCIALTRWGTGTVTVAAGAGATKRSSESAISAQYGSCSVTVVKNANGASAEFIIKGDVA